MLLLILEILVQMFVFVLLAVGLSQNALNSKTQIRSP